MKHTTFLILFATVFLFYPKHYSWAQRLSSFSIGAAQIPGKPSVMIKVSFHGYTNHWHNYYTEWHRYRNLFKIAIPELKSTILQSKVDTAEDLGIPGLLMQEGFISHLFSNLTDF